LPYVVDRNNSFSEVDMRNWLIILGCLVALNASAAVYSTPVEAGDTLIAANEDTTESILLMPSLNTSRCNNASLWITQTDADVAGVAHTQLQVITEVASENLAKASTGWWKAGVASFYVNSTNNPVCVPLPFLDGLTALYGRWRLTYVDGRSTDSTAYAIRYTADPGSPLARPTTRSKTIVHSELKGSTSYFVLNATKYDSTKVVDLRIETVPGWFQVPDRGWVSIKPFTRSDDDTIMVLMYSAWNGWSKVPIDTLLIPTAVGYSYTIPMSPLTQGSTTFPPMAYFNLLNDSAGTCTTDVFMEITVEKNP
jgi:hypothetical protein